MILGNDRPAVIEHIRELSRAQTWNAKAELDDPTMDDEQKMDLVREFLKKKNSMSYASKRRIASSIISVNTRMNNKNTRFEGLEKVQDIQHGAVITCNHFNHLDSTIVRAFTEKKDGNPLYTVIEDTNLALPGAFGFLMNYGNNIPISINYDYMKREFLGLLEEARDNEGYILIYPEQEMWFNYRRPRPGRRGAYYYASRLNLPVISLFVEIQDLPAMDDDNFHQVQYTVHVLDPLCPDPEKSDRANSIEMARADDVQRKAAYEKIYGKPLDAPFSYDDIAGYVRPQSAGQEDPEEIACEVL